MKIQIKYPAIAFCAALLAAGCSQDEAMTGREGTEGNRLPLVVAAAGIQPEVAVTRASTPLGTDKSIGVFLDNVAGSTANVTRNNVQYTNKAGIGWVPSIDGSDIYLKAGALSNVCAYYPYDAATIDATRVKLTPHLLASGETPLAYATNRQANEANRTVDFSMKQAYTWLALTFKRGDMGNDITLSEFSLGNSKLYKETALNIGTGVSINTAADAGKLTFTGDIALAKNSTVSRDILLPPAGTITGGLKVSVKVKEYSNSVLSTTLTGLTELAQGYKYVVTITVNTAMINVSAVEVMPWTETNVDDGAGNPLTPMVTPGINVPEEEINLGGTDCTQQNKRDLAKLIWAEGNLMSRDDSKPYDWAPTQVDFGYYYPWNSTYVSDGNTTLNGTDPCGKLNPDIYGTGWRTPGKAELKKLTRCTDKQLVTNNGVQGMWFMNGMTGIFLPAAGNRDLGGSGITATGSTGTTGYYWSSDARSYGDALTFSSGTAGVLDYDKTSGFAVRCVKGVKQVQ